MAGDANYNSVSLLLHADGSNGSTTITDSSARQKTVTCYGGAALSTTSPKFGTASLGVTLGSSSYATVSNASDFNFGSGNFTIEFWYYPIAQTTYSAILVGNEPDKPLCFFHGSGNNSGDPMVAIGPSESAWFSNASGLSFGAVTANTWVHLALVREGDTFRAFKDGVQVSTGSTDSTGQAVGNISTFTIGRNSASFYLSARIDELRITKGVARYGSGGFSVQTAAFLDYAGQVSGVIRDSTGAVCARTVRGYRRDTGALVASTTSDAGTGAYSLVFPTVDEVTVLALDNATSGTYYNDQAVRVIPD